MPARPLTHRQLEVLELVAKGLTNADIARVLGIGLGTAKHHVSAVIEALDVANRAEAAAALNALEIGRRVAPVPRGTTSAATKTTRGSFAACWATSRERPAGCAGFR
jgi:DNA-binding CsgD family transcriptional regulator